MLLPRYGDLYPTTEYSKLVTIAFVIVGIVTGMTSLRVFAEFIFTKQASYQTHLIRRLHERTQGAMHKASLGIMGKQDPKSRLGDKHAQPKAKKRTCFQYSYSFLPPPVHTVTKMCTIANILYIV